MQVKQQQLPSASIIIDYAVIQQSVNDPIQLKHFLKNLVSLVGPKVQRQIIHFDLLLQRDVNLGTEERQLWKNRGAHVRTLSLSSASLQMAFDVLRHLREGVEFFMLIGDAKELSPLVEILVYDYDVHAALIHAGNKTQTASPMKYCKKIDGIAYVNGIAELLNVDNVEPLQFEDQISSALNDISLEDTHNGQAKSTRTSHNKQSRDSSQNKKKKVKADVKSNGHLTSEHVNQQPDTKVGQLTQPKNEPKVKNGSNVEVNRSNLSEINMDLVYPILQRLLLESEKKNVAFVKCQTAVHGIKWAPFKALGFAAWTDVWNHLEQIGLVVLRHNANSNSNHKSGDLNPVENQPYTKQDKKTLGQVSLTMKGFVDVVDHYNQTSSVPVVSAQDPIYKPVENCIIRLRAQGQSGSEVTVNSVCEYLKKYLGPYTQQFVIGSQMLPDM
ncbi:hypothetical protein MP228_004802 [Amoeboaphelidium protococcarum]|nr:hypothetical protein MP228_004802 [Amoeboaphelidium protococcarum]